MTAPASPVAPASAAAAARRRRPRGLRLDGGAHRGERAAGHGGHQAVRQRVCLEAHAAAVGSLAALEPRPLPRVRGAPRVGCWRERRRAHPAGPVASVQGGLRRPKAPAPRALLHPRRRAPAPPPTSAAARPTRPPPSRAARNGLAAPAGAQGRAPAAAAAPAAPGAAGAAAHGALAASTGERTSASSGLARCSARPAAGARGGCCSRSSCSCDAAGRAGGGASARHRARQAPRVGARLVRRHGVERRRRRRARPTGWRARSATRRACAGRAGAPGGAQGRDRRGRDGERGRGCDRVVRDRGAGRALRRGHRAPHRLARHPLLGLAPVALVVGLGAAAPPAAIHAARASAASSASAAEERPPPDDRSLAPQSARHAANTCASSPAPIISAPSPSADEHASAHAAATSATSEPSCRSLARPWPPPPPRQSPPPGRAARATARRSVRIVRFGRRLTLARRTGCRCVSATSHTPPALRPLASAQPLSCDGPAAPSARVLSSRPKRTLTLPRLPAPRRRGPPRPPRPPPRSPPCS